VRDGKGTGGGARTGSAGGGTDLDGLVGAFGSTAGDAEAAYSICLKGIATVFILNSLPRYQGTPKLLRG
jgi:hypothetical protein